MRFFLKEVSQFDASNLFVNTQFKKNCLFVSNATKILKHKVICTKSKTRWKFRLKRRLITLNAKAIYKISINLNIILVVMRLQKRHLDI